MCTINRKSNNVIRDNKMTWKIYPGFKYTTVIQMVFINLDSFEG